MDSVVKNVCAEHICQAIDNCVDACLKYLEVVKEADPPIHRTFENAIVDNVNSYRSLWQDFLGEVDPVQKHMEEVKGRLNHSFNLLSVLEADANGRVEESLPQGGKGTGTGPAGASLSPGKNIECKKRESHWK